MKRKALFSSIVIIFCFAGTMVAAQEREASTTMFTQQTTPVISETEMKAVQGQNSEEATQKATQETGDSYGKEHEPPGLNAKNEAPVPPSKDSTGDKEDEASRSGTPEKAGVPGENPALKMTDGEVKGPQTGKPPVANKPPTDIQRDQEKMEGQKAQTGEGPPKAMGRAEEGTEKALEADEKGPDKGGGALKPEKPKAGVTARPLDRRWITKQQEQMKARPAVKAPSSLPWKNENQKARCEAYLGQMRENFLKARYHSIQGDSCNTAGYSRAFLSLVEICKRECPEGFLEKSGYTTRIIRNLNSLEELGTKRCVGSKKTGSN